MVTKIRRIFLIAAAAGGVVAASALPAAAGLSLANHCEPSFTASCS
jgi:hypothetical protein